MLEAGLCNKWLVNTGGQRPAFVWWVRQFSVSHFLAALDREMCMDGYRASQCSCEFGCTCLPAADFLDLLGCRSEQCSWPMKVCRDAREEMTKQSTERLKSLNDGYGGNRWIVKGRSASQKLATCTCTWLCSETLRKALSPSRTTMSS